MVVETLKIDISNESYWTVLQDVYHAVLFVYILQKINRIESFNNIIINKTVV